MSNKSNITVRVDANLKSQAQTLFANLGMDLSTAINIFLRQSIKYNGLPFDVKMRISNDKNKTAIEDSNSFRSCLPVSTVITSLDA